MKILLITIYTLILLISSVKAEECTYTYETNPEESKYTKQFSCHIILILNLYYDIGGFYELY